MRKLLLVIDYQNDFVAQDGALTCGKAAQDIEDNILKAIELHSKDTIYFTKDTHNSKLWKSHPESKLFPIHCVSFSKGHEIYGRVANQTKEHFTFTKVSYALDHHSIYEIVRQFDEVILCGVATNICVLQNAIALYNTAISYGFPLKFKVIENACASFDDKEHEHAIRYMETVLGFETITV